MYVSSELQLLIIGTLKHFQLLVYITFWTKAPLDRQISQESENSRQVQIS